ncbi:cyclic nucleotide-binding domain-containing protein [Desulfolutivibrio sulfoxidireducens]|uniref:cyclic nucleotide-binding domain-containing protein n=1 Tax=Desulfolutivibrio sulfoxidireducens TaxID=2773299 RepID=UPI00159DFA73|nr:cyclic nucleotide-binding domain-containing protein [Desulfolutivibrio sulfoxidireducens]QLA16533.1 cyclic nucleotide-binding domain-containing protein [Desulfolutivibrio sulfoxidireducens]
MRHDTDLLAEDGSARTKTFHKGALIYKEGQESTVAFLVKQGRVGVYRVVGNKRVSLGVRGPGQIFGEMGIISGETRTANAEALEFTEVIILDQALLRTMLLKSPRPVQIIAGYLVDRVRALSARITDRPTGDLFLSVCRILALSYRSGAAAAPKPGHYEMSYAEACRTVKDILLISQLEIDEIVEKLAKMAVVELTDVKSAYFRTDPLLDTVKKGADFVKDRILRIPDLEKFLQVAKNLSRELRGQQALACDLEFMDLADFAREAGTTGEVVYRKIGYREIPDTLFFFHKPTALAYIERMGPDFFKRAKRPRLTIKDLETVDDLVQVDNATLQEVFSNLGFHKLAVLAAMAGEAAREKIYKNLSKKIAKVVRDEADSRSDWDEDEAADVERELLTSIKTMKGLGT